MEKYELNNFRVGVLTKLSSRYTGTMARDLAVPFIDEGKRQKKRQRS